MTTCQVWSKPVFFFRSHRITSLSELLRLCPKQHSWAMVEHHPQEELWLPQLAASPVGQRPVARDDEYQSPGPFAVWTGHGAGPHNRQMPSFRQAFSTKATSERSSSALKHATGLTPSALQRLSVGSYDSPAYSRLRRPGVISGSGSREQRADRCAPQN